MLWQPSREHRTTVWWSEQQRAWLARDGEGPLLWALMSRRSTTEEKHVASQWKIERGCCGAGDLGEEASVRFLGGGRWGDLGHVDPIAWKLEVGRGGSVEVLGGSRAQGDTPWTSGDDAT